MTDTSHLTSSESSEISVIPDEPVLFSNIRLVGKNLEFEVRGVLRARPATPMEAQLLAERNAAQEDCERGKSAVATMARELAQSRSNADSV